MRIAVLFVSLSLLPATACNPRREKPPETSTSAPATASDPAGPEVEAPAAEADTPAQAPPATGQASTAPTAAQLEAWTREAAPPPLSLPQAKGAYDCKEDMDCFAERAKRCEHVAVRLYKGIQGAGVLYDVVAGGKKDGDRCYFRQQYVALRTPLQGQAVAMWRHFGIEPGQENALGVLERKELHALSCYLPDAKLAEVIDSVKRRGVAPIDWEYCFRGEGDCDETLPLHEHCQRGECKLGRFELICERPGGGVDRCRSNPKGAQLLPEGQKLDCRNGELFLH